MIRAAGLALRHVLWVSSAGIATLLALAFTASVVYVVVLRQIGGGAPDWAEELPRMLLVWAVFIGIVPATLSGGHFSAGLFATGSSALARARRVLARFLTAAFFAFMAAAGYQLTMAGMASFSTTLHWPYALTYAAVPLGCALAALAALLPHEAAA